jgi:beta-lactamase regulating signal transducer with metallopeptidase domain
MELIVLSVIKASLVLALAQILVHALPRLSAAARHLILTAGMAAFLIVPLYTLLGPSWKVTVNVPAAAAPIPLPLAPAVVAAPTAPAAPLPPAQPAAPAADPRPAAGLLWLVVAAAIAGKLLRAMLQLRAALNAAQPASPRLNALLDDVRRPLGGHPVRLLRSSRVRVPMVWGLRSGTLLVPESAEEWSDEQLRATFIHELGHLRRMDYVSLALMNFVAVLLWFNPQVWFARRRALIEGERACDDLVLRSGERPSVYAAHLLQVAGRMPRRETSGAILAMSRPSQLEGRMHSILSTSVNRQGIGGKVLIASFVWFLAVVIPLAAVEVAPAPPPPPPAPAAITVKPVSPEAVAVAPAPAAAPVPVVAPVSPPPSGRPIAAPEAALFHEMTVASAPEAPTTPAIPVTPVPAVAPVTPVAAPVAVPRVAPVAPVAVTRATPAAAVTPATPPPPRSPAPLPETPRSPAAAPPAQPAPPAPVAIVPVSDLGSRPFRVIDEVKGRTCTMRLKRPVNTGDSAVNPAEQLALQRLLSRAASKGADAVTNVTCHREIVIGPACPTAVACQGDAIAFQEAM